MYGQIGAPFFQRDFEFFHEQALAADACQRGIQDLVASRGHAQNFDRSLRIQRLQSSLNMASLPHGKRTFT
jgi:hypothetical protein